MDPAADPSLPARQILRLIAVAVVLVCCFELVAAVVVSRTTGAVRVSAKDPKARLSVSQPGRGAAIIGTGQAAVRLKPGTYQVAATDGAAAVSQNVRIKAGQTAELSLDFKDSVQLPSTANINFVGDDQFVDLGVEPAQVDAMKHKFFEFDKNAKTIVLTDIAAVPHDRNSASVFDTINFKAKIDSKEYNARLDYSALNDSITLYLYDTGSGAQVFNSAGSGKPAGE
jgi:hypothetical protein